MSELKDRTEVPAGHIASLALAQAFVHTIKNKANSMEIPELVDMLQVLNRTYDDFPELEADHPRVEMVNSLLKALNNVADYAMIPLLVDLIVIDSYHSASVKFLLKKIAESGLLSSSLPIL